MPMNRFLWMSLILLATSFGCRQKVEAPVHRDYLVISTEPATAWIRNFNPFTAATGGGRWSTLAAIYEPMMIFNRMEGQYVPWLATEQKWMDASHKELLVTLRSDVKWSDGQPFQASDVGFTFDLLKRFKALDASGVWNFLAGIDIVDGLHVRFRFAKPFAPGILLLMQQAIVPEHLWKTVSEPVSYANENPVGTGPYTELRLFENQVYELARNPYYWQKDKAKVAALRFPAYPGNDQVMLNLLKGNIDLAANFVPAVDRVYVGKDPAHHHYWFPSVGNTVFLYLNNAQPPYDQAPVRKAISRALDRDKIVKVAMFNYTEPSHPAGLSKAFEKWRVSADEKSGDWVHYDAARAGRELDELGFKKGKDGLRRLPDGRVWSLDIGVVTGWSDWVRTVQIMAKNLRDIGIDARMRTYDFGAWFSQVQRGEFQAAIGWSNDTVEPYEFYRWLMAGSATAPVGTVASSNWQRFSHPEVDQRLEALAGSFDGTEQQRLVRELQMIFLREAPAIPLFPNPAWGTANTRYFTNFPGPDHPYAVLSPNYRPEILQVLTEIQPQNAAISKL